MGVYSGVDSYGSKSISYDGGVIVNFQLLKYSCLASRAYRNRRKLLLRTRAHIIFEPLSLAALKQLSPLNRRRDITSISQFMIGLFPLNSCESHICIMEQINQRPGVLQLQPQVCSYDPMCALN